jgi:class 3 adenylate cyclase
MRLFAASAIALTVFLGTGLAGLTIAHVSFFAFVLIYPHVVHFLAMRLEGSRRLQLGGVLIDALVIGTAIHYVGFSPIPTLSLLTIALANGMALGSFSFMTAAAVSVAIAVGLSRLLMGPVPVTSDSVLMNIAAAMFLLLYFNFFAWVAYRRAAALQASRAALRQQKVAAEIEKAKSDRLLLAILPESAAREYETKGSVAPQSFPQATVLIADACGFGEFADRVGAVEAIGNLNAWFKAFDAICRRHGLEPLRTSGDAYLALASAHNGSAEAALQTALEMRGHMASSNEARMARGQEPLAMRFALHTGEVLAAVIETEKFSYDLFGETVALAFEVERLAPPQGVACSESVLKALVTKPAVRPIGTIQARRSGAFVGVLLVDDDPTGASAR